MFIVANANGNSDLYTMEADGTDRVQLTVDPTFDTLPQWAPGGETIWYATSHG